MTGGPVRLSGPVSYPTYSGEWFGLELEAAPMELKMPLEAAPRVQPLGQRTQVFGSLTYRGLSHCGCLAIPMGSLGRWPGSHQVAAQT